MGRNERVVDVAGVPLCVDVTGPADAPVLLLAHGAACSLDAWPDELVERLARERRVIRLDWRDTGRSATWPPGEPGYGLRDLAEDLVGVLDVEGVPSAHLVGLSMGGAAAQLVALDHPGRVRTLTLVSATPGVPGREADDLPPSDPDLFSSLPPAPDWSDRAAVVEFLVDLERPFQRGGFDPELERTVAERTVARAADIRARDNHALMEGGPGWRRRLRDIRARTLVVHGREDPLFPAAHGRALAREIPGAELLLLAGVGHGVPPRRDWPVLVDRLIRHTAEEPRSDAQDMSADRRRDGGARPG